MRVRLDLGYDGSDFAGWARQPGQRTVQDLVERALGTALRLEAIPRLTVAGRTDAGVHARGQVAHLDVPDDAWERLTGGAGSRPEGVLVARLAGLLPPDIRVRRALVVPDEFDARFSALWRRYIYRVGDADWGVDPLRRHEALWVPGRLDLTAMNVAAAPLLGEHDFAAYCRRRARASTVRILHQLSWSRQPEGTAAATVVADAFCHSMVRALVGALLAVGAGRQPPAFPSEVLAGRARDPRVHVVGPSGLTLEEVGYPPDDELALRAEATRRRRAPAGMDGAA